MTRTIVCLLLIGLLGGVAGCPLPPECTQDADCPDDGVFCNGDEHCEDNGSCGHSGSPCEAGECDEDNGCFTTCAEAADCNDDDACTTDDCVDGECENTDVDCDFTAELTGGAEVPGVDTEASGTGAFTLSSDRTELSFDMTASGLSGPLTGSHFHNGPSDDNGDVVFDFGSDVSEADGTVTASGVWELEADDLAALLAGDIYVNLHTEANPGGELRGHLVVAE